MLLGNVFQGLEGKSESGSVLCYATPEATGPGRQGEHIFSRVVHSAGQGGGLKHREVEKEKSTAPPPFTNRVLAHTYTGHQIWV